MAKKTPNNSARTKTAGRASKRKTTPRPASFTPTTWDSAWKSIDAYAPWQRGNPTTAELFRMYANEAKACFYELFRDHVELYYNGTGWPADPANWEPMLQERDALFVGDEQPQTGDQPGIRYGTTYGDVRNHTDQLTGNVGLRPLRTGLPQHTYNEHAAAYWMQNSFGTGYMNLLRKVVTDRRYADHLKEELRSAFGDIGTFNVGAVQGKAVMDRLRNDEQGQEAIATWEKNRDVFQQGIDALLNEPFGMDRDFTHLLHAALFAFASELRKDDPQWADIYTPKADHHWNTYHMTDTVGTMPNEVYNDASKDPDGGGTHFKLERWVPLYLERVGVIADRWKGKGEQAEVETRLRLLAKEVNTKATSMLDGDGTAEAKTKAEVAIRQVVDGIGELLGDAVSITVASIKWKGSVQQLAWMLRELAEKGWIGAPTHKGHTKKWKAGDINASAFAKAIAPHFDGMNLGTLEQELKVEGNTLPGQDLEGWAIPERPE